MLGSTVTFILTVIIKAYRLTIGLLLPDSCRYTPTCSVYALEALEVHGPWRGAWLAVRRVLRCHPWHAGGYDPVPGSITKEGKSF